MSILEHKAWDRLHPENKGKRGWTPLHAPDSLEAIQNMTKYARNEATVLVNAATSQRPRPTEDIIKAARELDRTLIERDRYVAWFAIHAPERLEEIRRIIGDPWKKEGR